MRHLLCASLVGAVILIASAVPARAQVMSSQTGAVRGSRINTDFTPGTYATSWGVPSFGWPRTYTAFSSPYGSGYGYGYYPYVYWPGYYGYRVWRPGYTQPGYIYGDGFYQTLASPHTSFTGGFVDPLKTYPPGFGPAGWYHY